MERQFKKIGNLLKKKSIQIFLLIAITLLAYGNILQNDFAWDDQDFIFNWFSIKDNQNFSVILSIPDLLKGDLPSNHAGVYRPLRSLIYVLSYKLWGTHPLGYHLQGIIIQIIAVILVYALTRLIINKLPLEDCNHLSIHRSKNLPISASDYKSFIPFMTAAIFAAHPIHTESISFITASFDTVGVVFLFLAFYFYLKSEQSKDQAMINRIASCLYAFFAFMTYEMTLIFPLLLIWYDFSIQKIAIKNWLRRLIIYLPYLILLVIYSVIRFTLLKIGNRADYLGTELLNSAIIGRMEIPEIIFQYISWLVFPMNLTIGHKTPEFLMSVFVKINNSSVTGSNIMDLLTKISIIIPLITVFACLVLIIILFYNKRIITFGIGWFLISLLIVINIIPQGATWAERFLYLPSFGFSLLLACLYFTIYQVGTKTRYKIIIFYLITIIFIFNIGFYSTQTFIRNSEWKNDESLFLSTLKLNPNDSKALNALGIYYLRRNQYGLAISAFKKAVFLQPTNTEYSFHLALSYQKKEDYSAAISEYKRIMEINPDKNIQKALETLIKKESYK